MAEQWMSIVEYARSFQMSDMTVRRRIKNGKLPAQLRDGKYYIHVEPKDSLSTDFLGEKENYKREDSVPKNWGKFDASSISKGSCELGVMENLTDEQMEYKIPRALQETIKNKETITIESRALLNFCSAALNKISTFEQRMEEKYLSQSKVLRHEIKAKDDKVIQLKQKIEDLQFLISVIEKDSNQ